MRILHVSDSHLGVERHVPGAPAGYRRHDDHVRSLRDGLALALRGEVDLVVHSGDLFDRSRPSARALADAAALMSEVARVVPVVVVHGNHDWRGYRQALPVPPPGLTTVDRPTRVVCGGVALALVPWVPTAVAWAERAREAVAGGVDLLVAHQAFDGARVPGRTFRAGADVVGAAHLPPGVRHVLCGHIHPRQRVRVGEAQVVMPGSTERTSFSERDELKGVAVWTLDRAVTATFVDVATRPMVKVERREDLDRVVPESLVRVATSQVDAAEVAARGGWWVAEATPRAEREVSPQLSLFRRAR